MSPDKCMVQLHVMTTLALPVRDSLLGFERHSRHEVKSGVNGRRDPHELCAVHINFNRASGAWKLSTTSIVLHIDP